MQKLNVTETCGLVFQLLHQFRGKICEEPCQCFAVTFLYLVLKKRADPLEWFIRCGHIKSGCSAIMRQKNVGVNCP